MTQPLLKRIAESDSLAVQECIDVYGGLIWSLALRLSPNKSEAEDAVQEIFIDIWKSASRFDAGTASEKTFVMMIARRRLIDRLRKNQTQREVDLNEASALSDSNSTGRMNDNVDAALAARVFSGLKPDQKKVLRLSLQWGLSHGEIAQTTDMAIGTVKSHIRRGLAFIRERLNPSERKGGSP